MLYVSDHISMSYIQM